MRPLRSKEESHDYRYFPDPDLPPLVLDAAVDRRAARPRCPSCPRRGARGSSGATGSRRTTRGVLTSEVALAEYFESVVAAGVEPKTAANWVMGDVMTTFNETGAFPVEPPRAWPRSWHWCATGVVSHQAAKRVYAEMRPGDPAASPRPSPSGSAWCR